MAIETHVILSREDGEGSAARGRSLDLLGMTRTTDLSVLIVTWNSARWIERCLRSIPAEYEVVLFDNASTDETLQRATGNGQRATILESRTNLGFAAGTNRALTASNGRYVLLLNPDCELEPDTLAQLFDFLETHPHVAAAVPLLVDEDGAPQREFQLRRFPTLTTMAVEVLLIDKLFPNNRVTARYRYRDLDLGAPQRIEQPAAAAMLVRRSVLEEIGPLDEQFAPAWFEDVDYCRRLAERKEEIWVVPSARVRHFGGASLEHMPVPQFIDVWYRNMWRYARKWMPAQAERLRWIIIGGMILRCCAAVFGIKHRGTTRLEAFRGYASVLRKAFGRWASPPSSS